MNLLLSNKKNIVLIINLFLINTLVAAQTVYLIPFAGFHPGGYNLFGDHISLKPFRDLKEGLAENGITLKLTGNAKNLPDADLIIVFNEVSSSILNNLKQYPIEKRIVFLWEPPVIIPNMYTQNYLSHFSKVFTWDDAMVDQIKCFKFFYPQPSLEMIPNLIPFHQKKLLTLVSKNSGIRHHQELFSKRREVVEFFDTMGSQEFYVYGNGWQQFKNSKGSVESKADTIKNYKFYLCYENTKNIQGYITEKIFDAFIAGVVPVYWGADNIANFIPENCFIDGKKFQNPRDLYQFLSSVTELEHATYIKNIHTFLQSHPANKFSCEYFVQNIIETLQLHSTKKVSHNGEKYKSQYGQDKFVNENFYHNKRNGIFVDIGAHDGITLSNTYFFEKELEWSGICIEPIPEVFNALKACRDCICIQGAISNSEKTTEFLRVNGYAEMLSGLIDKYDPRHINRINSEVRSHGGNIEKINVQCYALNNLLEKYGIDHIDYLSIDTEGGELDILKSINFDHFNITIIDVENNYKNNHINEFLTSKGYSFIKTIDCDEIYKKKE